MPVYPQKKPRLQHRQKKVLRTNPWKPSHLSDMHQRGPFPGFHQGHHCPIVVQLSWQRIHEIMSDNTCAFVRLHKVFALTSEFWKAHIFSSRSFANMCALLRVFALFAAGWVSAVTTIELKRRNAILWNRQSGCTIAWKSHSEHKYIYIYV